MEKTTALTTATGTMQSDAIKNVFELTQNSIYLMGASFVLGSLFTLFLLLVLDFLRRGKGGNEY